MVKNLPSSAGDTSLIPGLGRSPGGGNSNSLQYSCLGNPMDRETWRATVHGLAKELDTTEHNTAVLSTSNLHSVKMHGFTEVVQPSPLSNAGTFSSPSNTLCHFNGGQSQGRCISVGLDNDAGNGGGDAHSRY